MLSLWKHLGAATKADVQSRSRLMAVSVVVEGAEAMHLSQAIDGSPSAATSALWPAAHHLYDALFDAS